MWTGINHYLHLSNLLIYSYYLQPYVHHNRINYPASELIEFSFFTKDRLNKNVDNLCKTQLEFL